MMTLQVLDFVVSDLNRLRAEHNFFFLNAKVHLLTREGYNIIDF